MFHLQHDYGISSTQQLLLQEDVFSGMIAEFSRAVGDINILLVFFVSELLLPEIFSRQQLPPGLHFTSQSQCGDVVSFIGWLNHTYMQQTLPKYITIVLLS